MNVQNTAPQKERGWKIFEVTTKLGGNVRVLVDLKDIELHGERDAVGHAVWCKLFENEKDQWGRPTKRISSTARMLRSMCDEGKSVTKVKTQLIAALEYQEEK